jgi:hypothetical protein
MITLLTYDARKHIDKETPLNTTQARFVTTFIYFVSMSKDAASKLRHRTINKLRLIILRRQLEDTNQLAMPNRDTQPAQNLSNPSGKKDHLHAKHQSSTKSYPPLLLPHYSTTQPPQHYSTNNNPYRPSQTALSAAPRPQAAPAQKSAAKYSRRRACADYTLYRH